jgi:hypothetical protein
MLAVRIRVLLDCRMPVAHAPEGDGRKHQEDEDYEDSASHEDRRNGFSMGFAGRSCGSQDLGEHNSPWKIVDPAASAAR